jgi:hypothetical protein
MRTPLSDSVSTLNHAPRPVISRHANNPSVVPEAATALTGERQIAMYGDHAVATRSRQFLFNRPITGREDEAVDAGQPAVNDHEATAVDLEPQLSRGNEPIQRRLSASTFRSA